MKRWWKVAIRGRIDDRGRDVTATLVADDAVWAAYAAVAGEWPDWEVDHDYTRGPDGRRVVRFRLEAGGERRLFRTDHETFDEMAREITNAAELAALENHPRLPLEMGGDD